MIFQDLTYPLVGTQNQPRTFPRGLDVCSLLGSPRAAELLEGAGETKYEHYADQRAKLAAQLAAMTPSDWNQSLTLGWLYALQPLLQPAPDGWPAFMRNTAWQDKSLVAVLGSWTEMRHDTVLYGKQSVAEAGGPEPEPPAGYVEPQPVAYQRLAALINATRDGLLAQKLIEPDSDLAASLRRFGRLLARLATISAEEIENRPVSVKELDEIKWIGGTMEGFMLSAARLVPDGYVQNWSQIKNATDRRMALATDVHTSLDQVLQEAVGAPAELWVVAPFKERLVAFRGASFTHFEFIAPAAHRLTDEQWQGLVGTADQPSPAAWQRSYLLPPGTTTHTDLEEMGE
jgi:hypothetical protein